MRTFSVADKMKTQKRDFVKHGRIYQLVWNVPDFLATIAAADEYTKMEEVQNSHR